MKAPEFNRTDKVAQELIRQNAGQACLSCSSSSGHFGHCILISPEAAAEVAELERLFNTEKVEVPELERLFSL